MAPIYELRISTPAGVPMHRVSDFGKVNCTQTVNKPGLLVVDLKTAGATPEETALKQQIINDLSDRCQVELWRKDDALGIAWYPFFGGLYLAQHQEWDEARDFTLSAPGYPWLLGTRIINWFEGVANRSNFSNAASETIMKTLVSYNAGSAALAANGRMRDGAITGISIQADSGLGNKQDWACFGQNLLESLQKLQHVAGGDFDLIKTGAQAWEFRWYTGQRGSDRTATVIFSQSKGNLGKTTYDLDKISERTVACVYGQGQGSNRAYVTRTGATWSALNDTEMYIDARDLQTTAALSARGDDKLWSAQARDQFGFDIIQTPACMFGVHYFLGDLVMVQNPYTGQAIKQKVMTATLDLAEDGTETIQIDMMTP